MNGGTAEGGAGAPAAVDPLVDRLFDACISVVAERGYRRTTVEHVCAAAEVSVDDFYERFTGIEGCVVAAYRSRGRALAAQARRAFEASSGTVDHRVRWAMREVIAELAADERAAGFVAEVGGAGLAGGEGADAVAADVEQAFFAGIETEGGIETETGSGIGLESAVVASVLCGSFQQAVATFVRNGRVASLVEATPWLAEYSMLVIRAGGALPDPVTGGPLDGPGPDPGTDPSS